MDLWQQAVADDGRPVGEPLAVTQGLGIRSAAFSPDGTRLAYSRGGRVANVWRVPVLSDRPATWADAKQVTSEHAFIEFVDVSPDGAMLAVSSDRRGNQDLWLLPAAGGEMTPLTTDPTPDWNPRWSPDGREIAFYALSQWQPGHLGDALTGWSGATAHLAPGTGLVPELVARWPRDRVPFDKTEGRRHLDRGCERRRARVSLHGGQRPAEWSPDGHVARCREAG